MVAALSELFPGAVGRPGPREIVAMTTIMGVGLILRLIYIDVFRAQPFPPDVPWSVMLSMQGPFDTVPKEPLFVWWLKGLYGAGAEGFLMVRTWTVLWYLPTAIVLWAGGRSILGRWSLFALGLHAALPAQIAADANGERHVLETFFTVVLWASMFYPRRQRILPGVTALAALTLTRLNLGAAGALAWATRLRSKKDIAVFGAAVITAGLCVLPHFTANWKKTGDPFYSVNLHAYWFANKEFIGQPGFARSAEEWQKDAYRPSLNYRQWAFRAHTPGIYLKETLAGYPRIFRLEIVNTLLGLKLPAPIRWALTTALLVGLLGSVVLPGFRPTLVLGVCLLFPFAFVSHVHMAPRFFVPTYPLVAITVAAGIRILALGGRRAAARWRRI